jgi:hypothetical protein
LPSLHDQLPFPEDIADYNGFDLHPDRPFPADELPADHAWIREDEEEPDEALLRRVREDGWLPLRDFGCGEYDVLVVSGPHAGRVWTLTERRRGPARTGRSAPRAPARMGERDHRPATITGVLSDSRVRVNARRGATVRNVDIAPAARRKAYDAVVHTFPVDRPRELRTVERTAVPANELGALLTG